MGKWDGGQLIWPKEAAAKSYPRTKVRGRLSICLLVQNGNPTISACRYQSGKKALPRLAVWRLQPLSTRGLLTTPAPSVDVSQNDDDVETARSTKLY